MNTHSTNIATSRNVLDIVDKIADRERQKQNKVAYNFPECASRKTDIDAFQTLCATVFKPDICKAVHLGPKIASKHRMIFEDIDDKSYLTSCSYFLRQHDQYSKVYIVPNRTNLTIPSTKKLLMNYNKDVPKVNLA